MLSNDRVIEILREEQSSWLGTVNKDAVEAYSIAISSIKSNRSVGFWDKVEEQPYFRKHWNNICCSICRFKSRTAYNYCPNCGAKMEVKK